MSGLQAHSVFLNFIRRYMKKIAFTHILLFLSLNLLGQFINPQVNGITLAPVLASSSSTEGDAPFFNEQWCEGSVSININSQPFFIQKMKYDLKEDRVIIANEQGVFAFPKGSILAFTLKIFDEKDNRLKVYNFASGFDGITNYTPSNFFLVHFNSNKVKFLEKIEVERQQAPGSTYGSSTKDYVYVKKAKFILYKDNKGVEVKKNKKSILEALGGDIKSMESFIKTNKLNLKRNEDIIALLKYFETKA